jgi:spheroidene monooxygenase
VSFSLYRFEGLRDRLWAFAQMLFARRSLRRTDGIGFWKLFGSGTGEGFTPVPNTAVYAILATWPDLATARVSVAEAPAFRRYAVRSAERWTLFLAATSARGRWSGRTPFDVSAAPAAGPVAVLTRATLRLGTLARFWSRVPAISRVIGSDPNVAFKIGVGEVPWLHQVTFSIWPDAASMAAFARQGPHAAAIRSVRREGWFREELYARFRVVGEAGSWRGGSPIAALGAAA